MEVIPLRHDINSQNTKRALAEALKALVLQNLPANKITINEIIKKCGVNRSTFYYHFSGIDNLITWTLHNDIYLHFQALGSANGRQIREFVIDYMDRNQKFLTYAYQYLGYSRFRESYVSELYPIILDHIAYIKERDHIESDEIFERFIAKFCSDQVGALYLTRFHQPDAYHRESAIKCLEIIFEFSIPNLLCHEAEICP